MADTIAELAGLIDAIQTVGDAIEFCLACYCTRPLPTVFVEVPRWRSRGYPNSLLFVAVATGKEGDFTENCVR